MSAAHLNATQPVSTTHQRIDQGIWQNKDYIITQIDVSQKFSFYGSLFLLNTVIGIVEIVFKAYLQCTSHQSPNRLQKFEDLKSILAISEPDYLLDELNASDITGFTDGTLACLGRGYDSYSDYVADQEWGHLILKTLPLIGWLYMEVTREHPNGNYKGIHELIKSHPTDKRELQKLQVLSNSYFETFSTKKQYIKNKGWLPAMLPDMILYPLINSQQKLTKDSVPLFLHSKIDLLNQMRSATKDENGRILQGEHSESYAKLWRNIYRQTFRDARNPDDSSHIYRAARYEILLVRQLFRTLRNQD